MFELTFLAIAGFALYVVMRLSLLSRNLRELKTDLHQISSTLLEELWRLRGIVAQQTKERTKAEDMELTARKAEVQPRTQASRPAKSARPAQAAPPTVREASVEEERARAVAEAPAQAPAPPELPDLVNAYIESLEQEERELEPAASAAPPLPGQPEQAEQPEQSLTMPAPPPPPYIPPAESFEYAYTAQDQAGTGAETSAAAPRADWGAFTGQGILASSILKPIKAFFHSGHVWVAGGVLMLLLGFAFLVTYMSELFSVEMRIASCAMAGMAMVAGGLHLRKRKTVYALILQGGGIGVLYLSAFAAAKLTTLLPPVAALVIMTLLIIPAVALALLQSAEVLAIFGFFGGFAAPILLSSGSGDYVALFSYYTLLNLGLLAICRFRLWRWLNLVGAGCTFGVMATWGLYVYEAAMFPKIEPFLLGFMAIFLLISLISVHKKEFSFKRPPDMLLALGVPFAAMAFQWHIARELAHGLSLSAVGFGVFFILLGALVWKLWGERIRMLAEIYLATGVLVLNLALPLEYSGVLTSAVWAAEGALLFFFGCRALSWRIKIAALIMQAAAMLAFLPEALRFEPEQHAIIETCIIALSFMASAFADKKQRAMLTPDQDSRSGLIPWPEALSFPLESVLAILGLVWWFGGLALESRHVLSEPGAFLFCSSAASALAFFAGARFLHFRELYLAIWAIVPGSVLFILFSLNAAHAVLSAELLYESTLSLLRPMLTHQFLSGLQGLGWLFFTAGAAAFFFYSKASFSPRQRGWLLTVVLLELLLVFTCSSRALAHGLELSRAWISFAGLFPALVYICASIAVAHWRAVDARDREVFFARVPQVLFTLLAAWFVIGMFRQGSPRPLPIYLPLLNPLELKQALCIALFLLWQKKLRALDMGFPRLSLPLLVRGTIVLTFIWLHSVIARTTQFYAEVPMFAVWGQSLFQSLLTVLWGLSGMAGIIVGNKKGLRLLWVAGASLVGLDAVKLFLLDFADKDTLFRIISFFVMGGVFLLIGLLAPLPPAQSAQREEKNETKDADHA
ncbi:DUF2339 domain-containing protein [Desulfovibrio sp. OttesenSCG-928-A18]|nr:DUF2339 domain-containing protein [Desulfovibrio sp. OttesenSCG-928-A18]